MDNAHVAWKRLSTAQKILMVIVSILALTIGIIVENGLLMIFIGVIHSIFNNVPALGFKQVFILNVAMTFILRVLKAGLK